MSWAKAELAHAFFPPLWLTPLPAQAMGSVGKYTGLKRLELGEEEDCKIFQWKFYDAIIEM